MAPAAGRPLVCLGEALVDLICPDPVSDPADATRFEARFGGALANVAVAACRAGGAAALAGGCGDDDWGRFLRRRLRAEGVGLDDYRTVGGLVTPFAFVTLDEVREPTFRIHGDGIEDGIASVGDGVEGLVRSAGAVVLGSNTLPGKAARAITTAVRAAAIELGVPVLFDPNLRPGRWDDLDVARELCLEVARDASLIKCNLGEARWLLGNEGMGADACAEELARLGPRLVVITSGSWAVIARGACEAELKPPDVEMVSPLGAGDAFMGTLAAGLWQSQWELDDVGAVLKRAAAAGADACSHLGAFE